MPRGETDVTSSLDDLVQAVNGKEDGAVTNLAVALDTYPNLFDVLTSDCVHKKVNMGPYFSALFQACPLETAQGKKHRYSCVEIIISLIGSRRLKSQRVMEAINIVLEELENFGDVQSAKVVHMLLSQIRLLCASHGEDGESCEVDANPLEEAPFRLLDLVPKIWWVIARMSLVATTALDGGQIGTRDEFKDYLIAELCALQWPRFMAVKFGALFKELDLSEGQATKCMIKMLHVLRSTSRLQEMPPLIYQLIGLASKGNRALALQGITSHFSELEKRSGELLSESLCQVQGTVLLHLNFAMKQDQELAKEYLKLVKRLDWAAVAAFDVALLLAIARLPAFEQLVFDAIKTKVQHCFKDWVANTKFTGQQTSWRLDLQKASMSRSLLDLVQRSSYGWDYILPSVVGLGHCLMDSYQGAVPSIPPSSHKMHFEADIILRNMFSSRTEATEDRRSGAGPQCVSPPVLCCMLGMVMLQKVFLLHEVVRTEILERIFGNIVNCMLSNTGTTGCGAAFGSSSTVLQYISLLEKLVRHNPNVLLEYVTRLKEAVEYIPQQPPFVAACLISAVQPMLGLSAALQDYVFVVLRKAFHNRQSSVRIVAVNGFLQLLSTGRKVIAMPTMSQVCMPVCGRNADADIELLGVLRRCLSQQPEVRERLYSGLYEIFLEKAYLCDTVLGLLLHQFMQYYDRDLGKSPPLDLGKCLDAEGKVQEPLGHLVYAMQRCVVVHSYRAKDAVQEDREDEGGMQSPIVAIQSYLDGLLKRVLAAPLEEWELDKGADFSYYSTQGSTNRHKAGLLLSVCEVLMEYVLLSSQVCDETKHVGAASQAERLNQGKLEPFVKLFEMYSNLSRLVSEKVTQVQVKKRKGHTQDGESQRLGAVPKGKVMPWDLRRYLPVLSVEYSWCLLKLLNRKKEERDDESTQVGTEKAEDKLRNDYQFQMHLLSLCKRQLTQIQAQQEAVGMTLFADPSQPLATPSSSSSSSSSSASSSSSSSSPFATQLSAAPVVPPERITSRTQLYSLLACWAELLLRDFARHRKVMQHNRPLLKQAAQATITACECFELCFSTSCANTRHAEATYDTPLKRVVSFLDTALSAQMHLNSFTNCARLRDHLESPLEIRLLTDINMLRNFTGELIGSGYLPKETEIFLNVVTALNRLTMDLMVPEEYVNTRKGSQTSGMLTLEWCREICKDEVLDGAQCRPAARLLLSLYCDLSIKYGQIKYLVQLAEEVSQILQGGESSIQIVTKDVCNVVLAVLQNAVGQMLTDTEWAVGKLRLVSVASDPVRRTAEHNAHSCLLQVVSIQKPIANSEVRNVGAFEQLVKTITRFFKVLTKVAKMYIDAKVRPASWFEEVCHAVGTGLTGNVFGKIVSNSHLTDENMDGRQLKAKITREVRLVPNLVYNFELLQKFLVKLDKKWECTLMENFDQPLNRDGRFQTKVVSRHLQGREIDEEEGEVMGEDGNGNMDEGAQDMPGPEPAANGGDDEEKLEAEADDDEEGQRAEEMVDADGAVALAEGGEEADQLPGSDEEGEELLAGGFMAEDEAQDETEPDWHAAGDADDAVHDPELPPLLDQEPVKRKASSLGTRRVKSKYF